MAEAEHSAGWRNGRKGAFGKPKGNGITRRLRSAKSRRGNRTMSGTLPSSRDWSAEEDREALQKGKAVTGPEGLGLLVRGNL